jgi:hypothetical protein
MPEICLYHFHPSEISCYDYGLTIAIIEVIQKSIAHIHVQLLAY